MKYIAYYRVSTKRQGESQLGLKAQKHAVERFISPDLIDQEFDGFVRKLITYMMEDPRTISASLDLLFIAKAIERIGDHSKNIAEFIIYIVKGEDVRHTPLADIEAAMNINN